MDVLVGEVTLKNLASSSKFCRKGIVYPSPFEDEKGFVETIKSVVEEEGVDMVIPIADITTAILSENKQQIEPAATVATVDSRIFWAASDKNNLHRLADSLGVPTPTLFYIEKPGEISDILGEIPFPSVLKPARSRLRLNGRWMYTSVTRLRSRDELLRLIKDDSLPPCPFMIQREILGEGQGAFAICEHGEPKVFFSHRRIREKPPWGGVSVLRESIPVDPIMREYSERILKRLHWHGVAMVEFKREQNTGILYLMEINGRFWGSLQLAIDSGIDFPLLLVQLYKGDKIQPKQDYRVGIRSRWLLGDLDHLLARLSKKGRNDVAIPSFGSFLRDFIKIYQKNTYYEVESWGDLGPSLYELRRYLSDGLKGLLKSRRGGGYGN
jgi:predicted ATP-grasp superfamily ATP-dependent carboligase